jgi:hypothetical protein
MLSFDNGALPLFQGRGCNRNKRQRVGAQIIRLESSLKVKSLQQNVISSEALIIFLILIFDLPLSQISNLSSQSPAPLDK